MFLTSSPEPNWPIAFSPVEIFLLFFLKQMHILDSFINFFLLPLMAFVQGMAHLHFDTFVTQPFLAE